MGIKEVDLKNMCDACCGNGYNEEKEDCTICGGSGIEVRVSRTKTIHERVLSVYREQLKTFEKLGIGGKTQYNTIVTQDLIDITKKRMKELLYKKYNR
jgi:DnaJ-class molecular chaperone